MLYKQTNILMQVAGNAAILISFTHVYRSSSKMLFLSKGIYIF